MSDYKGKRVIVLDLETQKLFSEINREKLHLLKISVVGIYDSHDDKFLCFEEHEFSALEARLKAADVIVGFNIIDFDMRVLGPYLLTDATKFNVFDILADFYQVRGHRVSLQSLAQATLNDSKSGSGYDAIQLFRDGRMDDLKKYCLDDVRITRAVFDYGLKNKKITFFSNRDFSNHDVEVNWDWVVESKKPENAFPTSLF